MVAGGKLPVSSGLLVGSRSASGRLAIHYPTIFVGSKANPLYGGVCFKSVRSLGTVSLAKCELIKNELLRRQ
jgi:hypothetical protein